MIKYVANIHYIFINVILMRMLFSQYVSIVATNDETRLVGDDTSS